MLKKEHRCILARPDLWPDTGQAQPLIGYHEVVIGLGLQIREYQLAADCHLWLLAPPEHAHGSVSVANALGFEHKMSFVWIRDRAEPTNYGRANHEVLSLGIRGGAPCVNTKPRASVMKLYSTLRTIDDLYTAIETISPGPRLELFATQRRKGWDICKPTKEE